MDVGAHKKKAYQSLPNPDEEQWKRAFWFVTSAGKHLLVTDVFRMQDLGHHGQVGQRSTGTFMLDSRGRVSATRSNAV